MHAAPVKVLLVEDNPADARLILELLREAGPSTFHLTQVAALAELPARIAEGRADIVLLDLTLPDSRGLDTFHRATAVAPHMPFVVLTHLDDEDLAIQTVKEGAQDYLVKGALDSRLLARAIRYAIERKRSVEDLTRYRDHLEDLVAERTASLQKANRDLEEENAARRRTEEKLKDTIARLEAHDRARTEFVANVSHELRTPLTSIRYALDNLLRGSVGTVPDRVRSYLEMLFEDSLRLARTVNDILDLSRIEAGTLRLHMAPLGLGRLVRRTVESLRLQADERSIRLTVTAPDHIGFVSGDRDKMTRVILNVAENAIKYTAEGGTVDVLLRRAPEGEPPALVVEVIDSGIGVPPDALAHMAEPYFRIGEHVSGTGLGLAISKQTLEMHGGSIAFVSPPPGRPKGTLVRIALPAIPPPVLMAVDDDETILRLLAAELEAVGYRVVACRGGQEAIAKAGTARPLAVIMDLIMPGLDGMGAILAMKADPELRRIPIVVLTGSALDSARKDVLDNFGIPALMKPWQENRLIDCVEDLIVGSRYFQ